MKWQYKIIEIPTPPSTSTVENILNTEGRNGWEFIGLFMIGNKPSLVLKKMISA